MSIMGSRISDICLYVSVALPKERLAMPCYFFLGFKISHSVGLHYTTLHYTCSTRVFKYLGGHRIARRAILAARFSAFEEYGVFGERLKSLARDTSMSWRSSSEIIRLFSSNSRRAAASIEEFGSSGPRASRSSLSHGSVGSVVSPVKRRHLYPNETMIF